MTHLSHLQGDLSVAPHRDAAEEAVLLARVAEDRDVLAFEHLYRAYRPRLRHFLLRMTRRPALAEDVLDETMLVVWRKARAFNGTSKPSTWIFAIAWRQALKALRKLDEPGEPFDADELRSPAEGPEGELHQQQLGAQLRTAMAGLSHDHRAVIELTYFHGYACREIAEIMRCPVDTVKTRMFYARRRLKTLLMSIRGDAS
ncbi:MAG TPA: sigma-70 family RNA polymerase sigma factor [Rhodanobacteraceae bacterium]|nr:sigma-70 family RNA polymerase sigma factor [Rhodanobacteraceae bacterium]